MQVVSRDPDRTRDPDAEFHSGVQDIIPELKQTERGQRWYSRLSGAGVPDAGINTFFFTLDKVLGCLPVLCLRLRGYKTAEVDAAIDRFLESRRLQLARRGER